MTKRKKKVVKAPIDAGPVYELDDKDREILKYLLRFEKITNAELTKIVDLSIARISARRNKPAMKAAMEDMTRPIADQIKQTAAVAARRLKQLVGDENKAVAMRAVDLALKPFMAEEVNLNIKPVVRFSTVVQVDGSLLQQIIEEDRKTKTDASP